MRRFGSGAVYNTSDNFAMKNQSVSGFACVLMLQCVREGKTES